MVGHKFFGIRPGIIENNTHVRKLARPCLNLTYPVLIQIQTTSGASGSGDLRITLYPDYIFHDLVRSVPLVRDEGG
jgi:hypothetical protein